jgi:hypothetical protein
MPWTSLSRKFVQDDGAVGGQTRRMDTTHDQFINDSANQGLQLAPEGKGQP